MSASVPRLSGEDWQNWANSLLTRHYGPTEYQRVPDNDRGDAGLEGFTRTDGHAYQAFGCEEPISTKVRYEKQRDKITIDIGKFINNGATIQRLLGSVRITRWALFVPHYDSKELIAHAATKTQEVRDATLPYAADTFQVCICEESDFAVERDHLINAHCRTLEVTATAPTAEQIAEWTAAHEGPSAVLRDKLQRLPTLTNDGARRVFHEKLLDWFLRGQDMLDLLRTFPEVYAKVQKAKSHHETYLAAAIATGASPQGLLTSSINDLHTTLQREVSELHTFSSAALAHEAVADWLLRCPLDFPDPVPHA